MKSVLNSLITATAAAAFLAILAPATASAQVCYNSHGGRYSKPHRHVQVQRSYPRQRCATTYSSRAIRHPHYGGPIYYRNSSVYVRPSYHVNRSYRSYRSAPRYRTSSRGYRGRRSCR